MPPGRTIGFWTAVSLVMGNMIGSGVFLLPASLAPYGGVSLGGWMLSSGGAVLLALVFARLARLHPASGGPYAYTRLAYGDFAGFLIAWGYWISIVSANAAIAVALVGYLDPFVPALVRSPASAALLAVAAVWLLTIVNLFGVRSAGRVQVVTTALKILPLLVIGIAGTIAADPSHFTISDTTPRGLAHGLSATATLTLWALLGLECATIPAASVRDPERTIPRATVVGTLLTAAIYIISTVGVMGVLGPAALGQSTAPFADAARALAGARAADLVALGAAVSCFGALNGWILVVGQVPMAAANDGLFPGIFRQVSATGTPVAGMLVAAVLTTALVAMNYSRGLVDLFTFIILLSTLATVIPYLFCALAPLLLPPGPRARAALEQGSPVGGGDQPRPRPWTAAIVPVLAFVYSMWAIGGAGADVVYWGFLLLVSGVPVYVWIRRGATAPRV